jgi:hypothetical protein
MLIRCSDNCKFQEDGLCGLKNIYSAAVASSANEINDSGCIYYKPKNQRKQVPHNQKNVTQSNQERQKYF